MFTRLLAVGLLTIPSFAFSTQDAKLPVPPSGWDAEKPVPHGELKKSLKYQTRNNGSQVYSIHLPPGYSDAKKYPVLYLHHGLTDDQTSWTNQTKGRAHNILDNLYSQNKATPMVVVMPDGAIGEQGDFNGFAKFEDVLIKDLIPHIEATYSVSTEPALRAIGGLSMGGGQTLNFGFKYYTMFNWIGAFASAPNTTAAGTTIKDPAAVKQHVKFTYLSCGSADGLMGNTGNYHKFLDDNNILPHMYQVEQGEGHSWTAFNRSLYNYAQRIFTGIPTGVRPALLGRNGNAPQTTLLFESGRLVVKRGGASGQGAPVRYFLDGKAVTLRDAIPFTEIPNLK
jgi:enterochelin esterase-like enzyme